MPSFANEATTLAPTSRHLRLLRRRGWPRYIWIEDDIAEWHSQRILDKASFHRRFVVMNGVFEVRFRPKTYLQGVSYGSLRTLKSNFKNAGQRENAACLEQLLSAKEL